MKKLLGMMAVAALAAIPLATHAQDRDGWRDRGDGYARSAGEHGYGASARVYDRDGRRGEAARGRSFDRDRFDRGRADGRRDFADRDRDGGRFRGEFGVGFGYGGYDPYGGYYAYGDGYPAGGYGAYDVYSYPDGYGTYQPFDYDYSAPDDAYYASGPGHGADAYDRDGAGPDDSYEAAPNVGWSGGGPPVDCGQWVWREGRGAYQWIPAPCAR